jgi:hypothetical protein
MNALIGELFATQNPNYAPDGRKVITRLEAQTLANFFA